MFVVGLLFFIFIVRPFVDDNSNSQSNSTSSKNNSKKSLPTPAPPVLAAVVAGPRGAGGEAGRVVEPRSG